MCDTNKVFKKYFKSDAHKYAFALNHMEGVPRTKVLGLTLRRYEERDVIDEWYKLVKESLLNCTDLEIQTEIESALGKLDAVYRRIITSILLDDE